MMMNLNTPSPMLITVKHFGKTLTAELPWDSSLDEVYIAIQGLLVADGFSNAVIENHIIEVAEEFKQNQNSNEDES